jgi:hypothetical protein
VQVTVTPDAFDTLISEPIGAALLAQVPAGMVFSQLATPLALGPDRIAAGGGAVAGGGIRVAGAARAGAATTDGPAGGAAAAAPTVWWLPNAATRPPGYGPPGWGTPPPSRTGGL